MTSSMTLPALNKTLLNHFFETANLHNDLKTQKKIIELYEKHINDEFVITFAGHFSAGKSSMLNELLREEILPKSPIPTSANIVKIKAGSGPAKVYFNDEKIVRYDPPYDIELIKNFCMDKTNIKQIELTTTNDILSEGLTLIDTPGIDAADDYDRELTEDALHLTDILFYVMDYNHVQSEVNLQFLKQVQEDCIPFYIVVNQIDKHNKKEISFTAYKTLVQETFHHWQLKPEQIFFTSLKDLTLPNNDYEQLAQTVFQLKDLPIHKSRSFNHLIKEHEQFLLTTLKEQLQTVQVTDDEQRAYEQAKELQQTMDEASLKIQTLKNKLEKELDQSLNNAHLMPFETREQARLFLEAYEDNFKVGFFRRKQKTEQERNRRLNEFYDTLQTTVDANLTWSLRERLRRRLEDETIHDSALLSVIESLSISFTKEYLLQAIHPGATANGTYILNYTQQIANTIKQQFKRSFQKLWEHMEHQLMADLQKKRTLYESLKQLKKEYEEKQLAKKAYEQTYHDQLLRLEALREQKALGETEDLLKEILSQRIVYSVDDLDETILFKAEPSPKKDRLLKVPKKAEKTTPATDEHILQKISQTVQIIDDLPSFRSIVEDLLDKKDRLENRNITVALFGAFSAGKSSFANALIGKQLLPASPNPTTAAITRIHPETEAYPDGTIVVTFKDEKQLQADLLNLLKDFSPPTDSLETLVQWIQTKQILQKSSLNEMVRVYIESVVLGFDEMKQSFGKKLSVSLSTFHELATVETKACFVDMIDLYDASPIANQGITLVDTPGADSIHARHTDVSFNFIKNADALIYVTYYNHSFTKADREFISQLGRVKESFELDKMFFIVNAADLAKDEAELTLVVDHVREELLQLDVRAANIFAVSSKLSLENKLNQDPLNEQMKTFEREFTEFIQQDLTQLMTNAAKTDIMRTKQLLEQYIEKVNLDQAKKEEHLKSIDDKRLNLLKVLTHKREHIYESQLLERIKRQIYYVGERFSINFHHLFGEHFNPTTIKTGHSKELEKCLQSLIDEARFLLLQEIQAVSLRIEAMIRSLIKSLFEDYQGDLQAVEKQLILPTYTDIFLKSPQLKEGLREIDQHSFQDVLRTFRNKRAFFEQRESEQMKESLDQSLNQYVTDYLDEQVALMINFYQQVFQENIMNLKAYSEAEINQYINHQKTMLVEPIDVNILRTKIGQLTDLMKDDMNFYE